MLTKHTQATEDTTLNLPSSADDSNKINLEITDLIEKNALLICRPHSSPIKAGQITNPKTSLVKTRTRINKIKTRLGKIMNKLYDLEQTNEPEKQLNIDFGFELYQMEEL